jgi:hypothetical protein
MVSRRHPTKSFLRRSARIIAWENNQKEMVVMLRQRTPALK